VPMLCFECLQ